MYTVVDGMGVQRAQNTTSYTAWVFASYLAMPLVLRLMKFEVRILHTRVLPQATMARLLSLVAYTVVLWATHYADVGVVSALRETSVLWAVLISRLFLGEAFTWRRAVSTAVICSGVFLIVARMRVQGVLQRLLARPKEKRFEIVFGAQRYRAAQMAELPTIPVDIRDMSDAEVLEAQLVETCNGVTFTRWKRRGA